MSTISDVQRQMDAKLDEVMLDILDGRIVLDDDGKPVLDAEGNPLRTPPTAADLQAVRSRLRDLGVSRVVSERTDAANRIGERLGLPEGRDPFAEFQEAHGRTLKFPPIEDAGDDAATAGQG